MIHDNASYPQDQTAYEKKFNESSGQLEAKKNEKAFLENRISELLTRKKNVLIFLEGLNKVGRYTARVDIPTWHAIVEYVKVTADKKLIFCMRNGSTITIPLEEIKRRI